MQATANAAAVAIVDLLVNCQSTGEGTACADANATVAAVAAAAAAAISRGSAQTQSLWPAGLCAASSRILAEDIEEAAVKRPWMALLKPPGCSVAVAVSTSI